MPATLATAVILSAASMSPMVRLFGLPGLRLIALAVPAAAMAAVGSRAWLRRSVPGHKQSPLPAAGGFLAGLAAGALPGMLLAAADPVGPAALIPRLAGAVTDGWRRLLSMPLPVPATRSFTDLPLLLAAALTALIIMSALGTRPAAALVPATLGFSGLLTLGVHGPVPASVLAACFSLAALAFLLGAHSGARRRVATAAGAVVAVAGVTVLTVVAVNPGPPYDPRAALHLPLDVRVSQDPLALLPARLESPGERILTARLSGALLAHPPSWLVLAYTDYTGAGWQAGGAARPAAARTGAAGTGTAVVTSAAPVALLPHPANVLSSVPEGLGYDASSEMLASPHDMRHYSVTVTVAEPGARVLSVATVPPGLPPSLTAVPACAAAELSGLESQVSAAASAADAEAVRLQQALRSAPFGYSKSAAPGEGCGSIGTLIASHRGTSAQFATAFVLAARMLGLPARIAVGYLPGRLSGDTVTVTGADAFAWPQVLLRGLGWVDFDPTPKGDSAAAATRQQQPIPHKLPAQSTGGAHAGTNPQESAPAPAVPAGGLSGGAMAVLAAAAALALGLGWVAIVWLASARRRRRRRREADLSARILGAWDELLVPLAQAGAAIHGRSAPRVAEAAEAIIPDQADAVGQLAVLAERALYGEVGEFDAATAWRLSDRARAAASAEAGRRTRLWRLLVPVRRR